MSEPFQWGFLLLLLMFVCKQENIDVFHFQFTKRVTEFNEPLNKRQNELLPDILSLSER